MALWLKIDFFGQNWPNDTFLDYFELVIPGCDSNWMFQTESNGIKLTQMTHLEHHVTHHVTNNLNFESSYLVNQIKWIIQSATSLKLIIFWNVRCSKHGHVRTQTSSGRCGRREQKPKKFVKFKATKRGQSKRFFMSDISGRREINRFSKKKSDNYIRSFLFDYHVIEFSFGHPRYENFLSNGASIIGQFEVIRFEPRTWFNHRSIINQLDGLKLTAVNHS